MSSISSTQSVGYHQVKNLKRKKMPSDFVNAPTDEKDYQNRYTMNSLWSIWYGLSTIAFQVTLHLISIITSISSLHKPISHI